MKKSHFAAIVIAVLAILYFGVRGLLSAPQDNTPTQAASAPPEAFKVVVRELTASTRPGVLILRGRTEAARTVSVRAETAGAVASANVLEGSMVKRGQVLCRLGVQARQANLDQAKANREALKLEWEAARTLEEKGHRSANATASAKAAYDAAQAGVTQAQVELSNINIRAPFDGVFESRDAEVGDYLTRGQSCGVVAELDPLIIAVNVSELDIASVQLGMSGRALLASGQTMDGQVRYINPVADAATRTFRVEVQADNPGADLRAGMTAELHLEGGAIAAQRIPADTMVLNDQGRLGVRVVDETKKVRFHPVDIIEDEGDGVWVTGLAQRVRLIVEGQDFVRDGIDVEPVSES